jgi:hypothetical protein
MPIYIATFLAGKNGATNFLVEDISFKGGYQVRADTTARDAIDALNRKQGMLVYTVADGKVWMLNADLTTWSNLNQAIDAASTTTAGLISAADKSTLDVLTASGLRGLTANAPLVSSGGKTPTLSVPAATSAQDGYLKASDWIIFNAKGAGNGTVTSVRATSPVTSTGGTDPTIAMPAASASTNGYLTSTDWTTFNSKADSTGSVASVRATAPIVSSGGTNPTLSMTAATSSTDGYLKATDWVIFNSKGTGTVQSVSASSPLASTGGINPVVSIQAASSTQNGYLRSTDWVTFNSKGLGNVNSVAVQAPLVLAGTSTDPVITLPAASSTTGGLMSNTDKAKLDGIAAGATAYAHPTGDGNLHVPATSTTNNGKFLMAGASAGAISWGTPVGGVTSVNGQTGAVTITAADITGIPTTTSTVQFKSLGINTAAPTVAGEIRATDNITAYYSSDRTLKENITNLPNALARVLQLNGVEFDWTEAYMAERGGEDGYFLRRHDVGLIAQEVQAVLPEVVGSRENGTLAVKYDRVVALLVEAIKELSNEVAELKASK